MKTLPSALAAPWCIEERWLRVVFGVWSRGHIDSAALSQARAEWDARKASRPRLDDGRAIVEGTGGTLSLIGDVGVIKIAGPLFRHAGMLTDISGGTSYEAIGRGIETALVLPAVRVILLHVNSPGGEADGCSELADRIYAAGAVKPIYTYADGLCASAAYWLSSQTARIYAEMTTEIGSIGVRCNVVDTSAADEQAGVRQIEIVSSVSPGKRGTPIDNTVIGRMQTRIDDLASCFVSSVATGRGVSVDTVLSDFGGGDLMIASKAIEAGLADEIGNFTSTLEALASAAPTATAAAVAMRGRAMSMSMSAKEESGKPAPSHPEWQCDACNGMMGGSAKSYCEACFGKSSEKEEDEEDEEDEEAKSFTASALTILGVDTTAKAMGRMGALLEAEKSSAGLREQAAKLEADSRKHTLKALLEGGMSGVSPSLSLGKISKIMPAVLRGDAKKQWVAAVEKLHADAEIAQSTISPAMVLDAVCSVQISAEDLDALTEFVTSSGPIAAAPAREPERNTEEESADLSATNALIDAAAKSARATLDRHHKPAAK